MGNKTLKKLASLATNLAVTFIFYPILFIGVPLCLAKLADMSGRSREVRFQQEVGKPVMCQLTDFDRIELRFRGMPLPLECQ